MADEKRKVLSDRRKRILRLTLSYIIFIFINIVLNRLVKSAGLPLYLDNVGTLLGAVLGGYLPGIFIGYATNIINATADISNMYYAGISVLVAVAATFLAKRGFFDKVWKVIFVIPVLAIIGGVIGSILTILIFGTDRTVIDQILYDFKYDLLDKAITVIVAFIIIKIAPKRLSSRTRRRRTDGLSG